MEEKVLENMEEVGTNLNELVVQEYLPQQGDLPEVYPDFLPVPTQHYCPLYFILVNHTWMHWMWL